jgi:uncharacterized membrane protein
MGALVVFVKPMLSKYNPAVVTVTYYSLGSFYTLLLTCALAYSFEASDLIFHSELLPWLALAYAAVFATFYPYNALSWAGKQLTPGATTVYCTFQPVGTILLSFAILGSVITLSEGLGTVMVIAGLIITVYAQQYEKKTHLDDAHGKSSGDRLLEGSDSEEDEYYMDAGFRNVRSVSGNNASGNPLMDRLVGFTSSVPAHEPL